MALPASLHTSSLAPLPDFVALSNSARSRRSLPLAVNDLAFATTVDPAMLVVSKSGRIVEANATAERLFGYRSGGLCDLRASLLMPMLTDMALSDDREFSHLKFLSHCGVGFCAQRSNGDDFACGLSFVEVHAAEDSLVRIVVTEGGPA
ncbi:MAG: PAS domain-containing protein [Gammaproteobacteria bacterium]|nr:PAS domain-containing protein [Gammaproteobacteria bacterium]MBU1644922.1 PAS domain-containing protein [Gammaproteobacteria bacterium]MBU1971381.1 PAS domain-containing protein [Gammaproteobacteria bacterium]